MFDISTNPQTPLTFVMHQASSGNNTSRLNTFKKKSNILQPDVLHEYQDKVETWKQEEILKYQDHYKSLQNGQNVGGRIFVPFIQERDSLGNLIKKQDSQYQRSQTAGLFSQNRSQQGESLTSSPKQNMRQQLKSSNNKFKLSMSQVQQLQGPFENQEQNKKNQNNTPLKADHLTTIQQVSTLGQEKITNKQKIQQHKKTQSLQNLVLNQGQSIYSGSTQTGTLSGQQNLQAFQQSNKKQNQSQQLEISRKPTQNNFNQSQQGSLMNTKVDYFVNNLDSNIAYEQFQTTSVSNDKVFKNILKQQKKRKIQNKQEKVQQIKNSLTFSQFNNSMTQSLFVSSNNKNLQNDGKQDSIQEMYYQNQNNNPNTDNQNEQQKLSHQFKSLSRDQIPQIKKFGPPQGYYDVKYDFQDSQRPAPVLRGKHKEIQKWQPDLDYLDCTYRVVDKNTREIDLQRQLSRFQVAKVQEWAPNLYLKERQKYRTNQQGMTEEHQREVEGQIQFQIKMNQLYPPRIPKPILVLPKALKPACLPLTKQSMKEKTRTTLKKYNVDHNKILKDKFGGLSMQQQQVKQAEKEKNEQQQSDQQQQQNKFTIQQDPIIEK